jgi:amidohydrolase
MAGRGSRAACALGRGIPPDLVERLTRIRRDIHRRPELSNHEVETTALLRRELRASGVAGIRPIGPTGIVADIPLAGDGPVVVVRADMDALPITEEASVPFRSQVPGVMHACGHDAHSAMALGVAVVAQERLAPLPGTLRVIFQPAEETEPLGGRAVVQGGHLDGVAAAIALHVDPDTPVGQVGLRSGPTMASSDEFAITVRGRSSHAGWPQEGADAIAAASAVVQELQKVVTRRVDPRAPVALNIGSIHGGQAANVVADEVRLEGTIRTLDEETRATVCQLVGEVAGYVAAAGGVTADVELTRGEPVLENHPAVTDRFEAAAHSVLGAEACRWLDLPTTNSEDFAFYAERVPSAMAWIGVRNEARGIVHPLHHPGFAIDEAVIPLGVELLLNTAGALLEDPPTSAGRESGPASRSR